MRKKWNKCKGKAWCWSCDHCQNKTSTCFVINETITCRDGFCHLNIHYNNPNQYLSCRMCKLSRCRLSVHLYIYRFAQKIQFKEYAERLKIIIWYIWKWIY